MAAYGLTDEQASIICQCLGERRDSVIRRMDVYRRMGDVLSPDISDKLIAIAHSELEPYWTQPPSSNFRHKKAPLRFADLRGFSLNNKVIIP